MTNLTLIGHHHPYQYLHSPEEGTLDYYSLFGSNSKSLFSLSSHLLRIYSYCINSLSILKNPSSIFVSKEVASNEKLWQLKNKFHDSKFIIITRRPESYLSSLKPLLTLSTISKTGSTHFKESPEWWQSWYEWLVKQADAVTQFYKENKAEKNTRVLHVCFESLVKNPHSEMKTILDFLGLPITSHFTETIDDFQKRQAGRARGYEYDMIEYMDDDFADFLKVFYSKN